MTGRITLVLEEVEVLTAEATELAARGPHFRILHGFHQPGTECCPGEEIVAVWLIYRVREYRLPLSTATLILFDYLARFRWLGQTASQIEMGIRSDPFCAQYGSAGGSSQRRARRIARSAVKEYVKRIRDALAAAFQEAGVPIDPRKVLFSDPTTSNQVGYRLRASIEWIHVPRLSLVRPAIRCQAWG